MEVESEVWGTSRARHLYFDDIFGAVLHEDHSIPASTFDSHIS